MKWADEDQILMFLSSFRVTRFGVDTLETGEQRCEKAN